MIKLTLRRGRPMYIRSDQIKLISSYVDDKTGEEHTNVFVFFQDKPIKAADTPEEIIKMMEKAQ